MYSAEVQVASKKATAIKVPLALQSNEVNCVVKYGDTIVNVYLPWINSLQDEDDFETMPNSTPQLLRSFGNSELPSDKDNTIVGVDSLGDLFIIVRNVESKFQVEVL